MTGQAPRGDSHTVAPGDTLSRIAWRHDTTVQTLVAANPSIDDPDRIPTGLQLSLPASPPATSDLRLERLDLQDREATIRPGGTLRLDGAGDRPQVAAQLRQTAL